MGDIKSLDLNLLKAFDALMDERSVTRAALRLSLTQPAVSGMLTRLRDNFGDPLFLRTQRGVEPTLRALALAAPIKHVLAEIEAMLRPAEFDPASAALTLRIAATDYALRAIVVPFLARLRPRAPQVRVAVRPVEDRDVAALLERGEIDLALMTPQTTPPGLHARHLYDEHYACALRADHPDAATSPLPLDRFCALEHALVSLSGDPFIGATDVALAKLGRERRVVLSVTSFLMLPELLLASDLVAVAPSRLIAGIDGLAVLAPPIEVPGFSKVMVWHERTHRDPGHEWVRAVLGETCAEPAAD